jgi:hypothetical protein
MEAKGSLPHSQELSTCPYPEQDQYFHQGPFLPKGIMLQEFLTTF